MKFGQLIEYHKRNIFLAKLYTKCGGETIPVPFLKIKIEHISGSIVESFIQFVFIMCWFYIIVEDYWNTLKLRSRSLAFTSYKNFLKNKKRCGARPPASFFAWFLKKCISLIIFYYPTNFHCLVAFISWDIWQYLYFNCLLTRLWRHKI